MNGPVPATVALPTNAAGSLVVPAFNEAKRLPPLLPVLSELALEHNFVVVIACNGCRDETAALATAAPGLHVLEFDWASKPRALNEADRYLGDIFPRLYVDADVRTSVGDLLRLADALRVETPRAVRPSARYDTRGAPWPVRDLYRCRDLIPSSRYWLEHHIEGHHIYGTNRAGRSKFDRFPEEGQMMEDAFFDRMFDASEKFPVLESVVVVPLPQSVRELFRARVRIYQGNWQLTRWLRTHRPDRLAVEAGMPRHPRRELPYLRYLMRGGSTFASWKPLDVRAVLSTITINKLARGRAHLADALGRQSPWR